jgi:hypothetical protein
MLPAGQALAMQHQALAEAVGRQGHMVAARTVCSMPELENGEFSFDGLRARQIIRIRYH